MAGKWKAPSPTDAQRKAAAKKAAEVIAKDNAAKAEAKRQADITKQVKDLQSKRDIGRASIKRNTDAKAQSKAALISYLNYIGNPATYTVAQAKIIAGYNKNIDEYDAEAKRQQKQLDEINAKIKALLASRTPKPFVPKYIFPPKPKEETPPPPPSNYDGIKYKYNIPMMKNAMLHPFGVQSRSVLDSSSIGGPTYTNGRQAFKGLKTNDYIGGEQQWQGVVPSRGTIQMSKMFAENAVTTQAEKDAAKKSGMKFNDTPYGFRFLYNPTDVSMAWGIVDAFSPQYAASGANGMTGVAAGLMKGTIAFTLILNRIEDMGIIYPDGSYAQLLDGGWAKDPDITETKMIYKKGTMYDIEYLFRAMNGFYADYQSGLNGITADKGWLQPIPMELHLGAGLRYLVRVSSLDLKHMMFNERMVPILTTVNIVCTRYYDTATGLDQNGEFDRSVYNPESPGSTSTS
jgi:hypothetical protein